MVNVFTRAVDEITIEAINCDTNELIVRGTTDYVDYCLAYKVDGEPHYKIMYEAA